MQLEGEEGHDVELGVGTWMGFEIHPFDVALPASHKRPKFW